MYDMKLLREKSLCIAISHCFMYCFHTVMACVALVSIETICVLFVEKYFKYKLCKLVVELEATMKLLPLFQELKSVYLN